MAQSVSTYAEARDNMRRCVQLLNELDKFANSNGSGANVLDIINTVLTALNGDLSSEILSALQVIRTSITGGLSQGSVKNVIAPALKDMMLALNEKDKGFDDNSLKLRDYMRTNTKSMNSSGMTFGTPAAGGSNQGDGGVYRLTVDDEDFPLEATHLELKTLECLQARDQGRRYKETFQYRGTNKSKDNAIVNGSGLEVDVVARNGDDSAPFLNNPHMILSGSTQPTTGVPVAPTLTTSITSWILSDVTKFELDVDTVYRAAPGLATAQSLRMKDNASFKQIISDEKRPLISLVRPVFVQWPVYRAAACDGQLVSTFGTDTKTIADITATFVNSAWNLVTHDLDKNRYFKNFRTTGQNDLELDVALTGRSVGSLFFAAPIVTYMDLIDGHYITVVGGAADFRVDDIFTFTDSQTSRGSQKYWLEHRSGLQQSLKNKAIAFSYPSNNAGSETWADL